MYWSQFGSSKALCCSPETPIRQIVSALQEQDAPVLLLRKDFLHGILYDCRALVSQHAYPQSDLSIEHLLHNVMRVFLLARGTPERLRKIRSGDQIWLELTGPSEKLVAAVVLDAALLRSLDSLFDPTGEKLRLAS
jgi:hypothetical protein